MTQRRQQPVILDSDGFQLCCCCCACLDLRSRFREGPLKMRLLALEVVVLGVPEGVEFAKAETRRCQ